MNGDDIRAEFARPAPPGVAGAHADDAEGVRDHGSFGRLRGPRDRALMLELIDRRGNSRAFGYPYLIEAAFDPSAGIRIRFTTARVRVQGRNLRAVYDALILHRLAWVREGGPEGDRGEPGAIAVYEIVTTESPPGD